MKSFARIFSLEIMAIVHQSIIGILFPMLLVLAAIVAGNSSLYLKFIVIVVSVGNIDIINKGFSLRLLINNSKNFNMILSYSSIKYITVNLIISGVIISIASIFVEFQFWILLLTIVSSSIVISFTYFLLLFYVLQSTEINLVGNIILFVSGMSSFSVILFLSGILGLWIFPFMITLMVMYFLFSIPTLNTIFIQRYDVIMEKIL